MENKSVKINWALILAICTFWTYAFFAAVSGVHKSIFKNSGSLIFFTISSLTVVAIFAFFLRAYFIKEKKFKDSISYTVMDRNVFVFYLLLMIVFSWNELNNQIYWDQLAHTMVALMHSTEAVSVVVKFFPFIEIFEFKNCIYIANVIFLVTFLILIGAVSKFSTTVKLVLFSSVFLICRFAVIYLGGGFQDIHPPLRIFPVWISSTLLYPSDFSFRLPQLLAHIVLMYITYKFSCRYFSTFKAILLGLVVGTIPILWHVGTLVEFSIWSALCVTYLLFCLLNKAFDGNYTFNLIRICSIVSVGILLRQPIIICVVLLIAFFIYSYHYENKYSWKQLLLYLAPLLVCVPFILKSIFLGTPATDTSVSFNLLFSRVVFSITSQIGPISMVYGALYWVAFIPFLLLVYKKNKIIASIILLCFVTDYIQFYLIKPVVWGACRYQAEYVIPFAIIGFFLLMYYIGVNKYLYVSICTLLITANTYVFKNIYNLNKSASYLYDKEPFKNYIVLSELIYPYREALLAAKNAGYGESVYLYGGTYGVLPQILAGYTVKDVMANKQYYESLKRLEGLSLFKSINDNIKIKLLLLCDASRDLSAINYLKSNGWIPWSVFYDNKHKSRITGFIRQ